MLEELGLLATLDILSDICSLFIWSFKSVSRAKPTVGFTDCKRFKNCKFSLSVSLCLRERLMADADIGLGVFLFGAASILDLFFMISFKSLWFSKSICLTSSLLKDMFRRLLALTGREGLWLTGRFLEGVTLTCEGLESFSIVYLERQAGADIGLFLSDLVCLEEALIRSF